MENPPKERETRRYRAHHRTALGGKGHCSEKEEAQWACQPALSSAGSESPGACYPPGPAPSLQSRPFNYRRVRDGVARVMEPAAVLPPQRPPALGEASAEPLHQQPPSPRPPAACGGCQGRLWGQGAQRASTMARIPSPPRSPSTPHLGSVLLLPLIDASVCFQAGEHAVCGPVCSEGNCCFQSHSYL